MGVAGRATGSILSLSTYGTAPLAQLTPAYVAPQRPLSIQGHLTARQRSEHTFEEETRSLVIVRRDIGGALWRGPSERVIGDYGIGGGCRKWGSLPDLGAVVMG